MTVLHDEVNVLVVGAGAAGAAFTWRLASLGVEVTCLEQAASREFAYRPQELGIQTDKRALAESQHSSQSC
jgi:2-polyprenyl-6-methoxyphenol hydroxylase-like FAD-dependent oxidoreductase